MQRQKELRKIKEQQKRELQEQLLQSMRSNSSAVNLALMDEEGDSTPSPKEEDFETAKKILQQTDNERKELEKRIQGPTLGQYAQDNCFQ